jgi:hypothetical protein
MRPLTGKTLAALAALVFVGALAAGGVMAASSNSTDDVKGPCDELEHANDPECAGPQEPEDNFDGDRDGDEPADISGPCDELEHANDPECTGAAGDDDSSGPGPGDRDDDDRDGDNSGPGDGDD